MIIVVDENSPFRKLWEKVSGRDELEEMAGLRKFRSGLPVNLWLDDSKSYIAGGHSKRIKFQGDYGNDINRSNLFSMTISEVDPQIPAKQLPKLKLKAKDVDAIKLFVKNNAKLLDSLSDAKIDIGTFLQKMKV